MAHYTCFLHKSQLSTALVWIVPLHRLSRKDQDDRELRIKEMLTAVILDLTWTVYNAIENYYFPKKGLQFFFVYIY